MVKYKTEENKIALITGSAKKLGREISIAVAKLGYDIILNYNSSKKNILDETVKDIQSTGVTVYPLKADISKMDEIKNLFKIIKLKFKKLDLLVNNAAIYKSVDFFDITPEIFSKFIDTNLKSVLFCTLEAAKIMHSTPLIPAKIINIASLGAIMNWSDSIPYAISKSGVIKVTQLTAKRLAPGILINAIAPGTIYFENEENPHIDINEINKFPLKRFTKPEDVASVVSYLVKDNTFMTGHTFVVDGGRSL